MNELKRLTRRFKFFITANFSSKSSVRDTQSKKIFERYRLLSSLRKPIDIAEDLALIELKYLATKTNAVDKNKTVSQKSLALCWRGEIENTDVPEFSTLKKWFSKNLELFRDVYLCAADTKRDFDISNVIRNWLALEYGIKTPPIITDNNEIMSTIYCCDVVVTSRLHIAVFGSILDKPTFILPYSDKIVFQKDQYNYNYKLMETDGKS